MAPRSLIFSSLLLSPLSVWALQVTPNSPCSVACQDSDSLDTSDPNSSNTKNADITCQDVDYQNSAAGIKWKNCMTCLQNSTFAQGGENDQMWFLYNSRYALSYCIFGFPNATDIGVSPCITSTACGPLENALEHGIKNSHGSSQYEYCAVDGDAMTTTTYDSCLSCISVTGETLFAANYLVAAQAGCLQKPAPGKVLGLNATVFSPTVIEIVDPATVAESPKSGSKSLPTTTIAVIAICSVIAIAIVAALIFVRRRQRKNRLARAVAKHYGQWEQPQSPLSFQCQSNGGPKSAKFFRGTGDSSADEMSYAHSPIDRSPASMWKQQHPPVSSFQNFSAITERDVKKGEQHVYAPKTKGGLASSPRQGHHPNVALHSLDTSGLPAAPSFAYHSPSSAVVRCSPSDIYTTPTSTTSTRSTTQLLPKHSSANPYTPADVVSPVSAGANGIPPSLMTWRPVWASASPDPPELPPKSPRMMGSGGAVAPRKTKRGKRESCSPVESRKVDVVFPPPPTGR